MRWKTNAALALALLLVGGFYYVYEVRWAPDRERAETRKGRVFSAEATDVTGVELKRREDTVRLTRAGEAWELKSPVVARADRARVEETLTTVLTARVDREIDPKPAALGDFGLDKPAAEVTLTLKDGKRLGLALGNKSPTGVWVYAREAGKPAVVALSDGALREATKPATEFRDRTVLAFERGQVSGFDVTSEGETLAVTHAGEAWRITRPVTLPADTEAVGEMFEKLTAAKVKEFVAEAPRSPATYGLDRPLRLTIHTGKDKERASRTLLVGRTDTAKKGVYAMREGESSVLLLPEDVGKAIPRTVGALRDKQVLALDRDKITRIEVESPKGAVTLAREKEAWTITAPQALPADQVEAGALLTRLRELRARGFLSDDASAVPRVLAKPTVKLTITEQGKPPTTVLDAPTLEVVLLKGDGGELARLIVGRRETDRAYVRTGAGPAIYAVDPRTLGPAPRVPDDLKG